MEIQIAVAEDAERIARLHAASWRTAYRGFYSDAYLDGDVVADRLRVWRERFAGPREHQHVLLATERDDLLGFVCAYGDDDDRWGTLVDNLHVRSDQQGRGVGRRLLAEGAKWSREHYPAAGYFLWVIEDNAKARRFYDALGGEPAESKMSEPPGGGSITALRYIWPSLDPLLQWAD